MKNNLTIAIIDSEYHALASKAIDKTLEVTDAKSVVVLSDKDFYPGSTFVKIDALSDKAGYDRLVLKELGKHITTDHFLVIQYDGMATDASKWQDDFLKYDYIGAPWPWGDPAYSVGNGGFSLRSRKLAELCLDDRLVHNPPEVGPDNHMEDKHIAVFYKQWLMSEGINYASVPLARQFSAEIPGGKFDTFGFHGTLCLPFYLNDEHLAFYIDNLTTKMLTNEAHIRIMYGLFRAERYEHLEQFMDKTTSINPNFKQVLLNQFPRDAHHYPEISLSDIETLLINY